MLVRHTLTASQIIAIKKRLAKLTGKFEFDISDNEVFDEVERIQEEEDAKAGFGRNWFCNWEEAIEIARGCDH